MGFFDNFYKFENYIGYTNDLLRCPTLYFKNDTYFGRITTFHRRAYNVGRQKPRNVWLRKYLEENRNIGSPDKPDIRHFEEHSNPFTGKVTQHMSRAAIIRKHPDHKTLVEYWIKKFPFAKSEDKNLQQDRLKKVHNPNTGKREYTVK